VHKKPIFCPKEKNVVINAAYFKRNKFSLKYKYKKMACFEITFEAHPPYLPELLVAKFAFYKSFHWQNQHRNILIRSNFRLVAMNYNAILITLLKTTNLGSHLFYIVHTVQIFAAFG
jgi:hypothetical protein